MLSDNINKTKVAIVVVGYNRLDSISRLLKSLNNAIYEKEDIPLYISIDCSEDTRLYDFVNNYNWNHGEKYVNIQKTRLGLRQHILQCGDLTKYFKGIILLEDDIYVSRYFYKYAVSALEYYYYDSRIAGISLYRNEMGGTLPVYLLQDGNDVFLRQSVASWGECWSDRMWAEFREWYNELSDESLNDYDIPLEIKSWSKAWTKFYMAYEVATNKYFVFPSVSLTTCFNEAGEHGYSSTIGQVNLLMGPKDFVFKPFEELSSYDIYTTNERIYDWIGINKEHLCVSFRGTNPNYAKKRYILTPYHLPYSIVKSFSLSLCPIELNIKDDLRGDGIYLYDSYKPVKEKYCTEHPLSLAYYYLKNFNVRLLIRYAFHYIKSKAKSKIIKQWKKIQPKR